MRTYIHEKAAVGFNRAGDCYERGRPEYPQEAVEFLVHTLGIQPESKVVDLGAGTGKFTRMLIPHKCELIAVEPVEGMRDKFHSLLPDTTVLDGSAEKIPLQSYSVDAVIAAQSFHWFKYDKALKEIHRVLKPGGKLGLIWNVRDESVDWAAQLTHIIDEHAQKIPRYRSMEWMKAFERTHLFPPLKVERFSYTQVGTIETMVDRVSSISFIAALPLATRENVLRRVRELVLTHPETRSSSVIRFPYITNVYWC